MLCQDSQAFIHEVGNQAETRAPTPANEPGEPRLRSRQKSWKSESWESGVECPLVSEIEARVSEWVRLLLRIMSVSEDGSSANENK
jgi:hypothetical protein